jgi:hypothetical protein
VTTLLRARDRVQLLNDDGVPSAEGRVECLLRGHLIVLAHIDGRERELRYDIRVGKLIALGTLAAERAADVRYLGPVIL